MFKWGQGLVCLAVVGLLACGRSGTSFDRELFYRYRMISHEMGEIDGNTYLSCRECFEKSYAAGQRYLEADLMVASDGKIVAMHDGAEHWLGLPVGFTSRQFMSIKLLGKYTPLDGPGIAELMKEKTDWYLVTDMKTDNAIGLKELCAELDASGVDCRQRVLPEIFSEQQLSIARQLGFQYVIFALYKLPAKTDTIQTAVKFVIGNSDVIAVSMPVDWWNVLGHGLLGNHPPVPVYVHTVDDPSVEEQYFAQGVTGLYSNRLPPAAR